MMKLALCRIGFAALVGLATFGVGRANAQLAGHTIHAEYYYPEPGTVYEDDGTQTVSPTATFTAFFELQAVVSDSQLVLTDVAGIDLSFTSADFNGFVFTDQGGNLDIGSFTIDPATNVAGFTDSDVTLTQGSLGINVQGISFPMDGNITLDFTAVPEPSSLALCAVAGLGGLGCVRRRVSRAKA